MSVLIKGMEMPLNCDACPLFFEYRFCSLTDDHASSIEWKTEEKRMPNCPLIELPEHGDLIEREYAVGSACSGRIRALPTTEDGEDWIRVEEVRQSLKSVPVVIPAERNEE